MPDPVIDPIRRAWIVNVVLVVALALALVWSYRTGLQSAPSDANQMRVGDLEISAADLDFGEVWEEKPHARNVTVRNVGSGVVTVTDFMMSCSCASVEPRSFEVARGGEFSVRLLLDLTHRSPQEIGLERRVFQTEVIPMAARAPTPQRGWRIKGTVRSRATLGLEHLHFGQMATYNQAPVTRQVGLTLHVPADGVKVKADKDVVAVAVKPAGGDASGRYVLNVTPRADLPPGPFACELTVFVQTAGGLKFGASLPVEGEVQPEVRVLPARLLLGSKPVNQVAESVVVLQVPAGADFKVHHIEAASDAVQVSATSAEGIPPGRAYLVRQRIAKAGDQETSVRFMISVGRAAPPKPVTMSVSYFGVTPEDAAPQQGSNHD